MSSIGSEQSGKAGAGRPCPGCGGAARERGVIHHPRPTLVAGVAIDLGATEFHLRECGACGLNFKDPAPDEGKLLACYARAEAGHWYERPDPRQRRFDDLRAALERWAPGPEVLDVGCFNGAMLEYFGVRWRRFGVEPSGAAAEVARERGVEVLGATIADVEEGRRFDAICAVDVLEHVVAPAAFLARVAALLKPGGVFLALTGDASASAWRWLGARYWYCSLPEHVTFFSGASLSVLAARAGLRTLEYRRVCHGRYGVGRGLSEAVKNAAFGLALAAGGERWPGVGARLRRRGPGWITARDHMIHVTAREGGA